MLAEVVFRRSRVRRPSSSSPVASPASLGRTLLIALRGGSPEVSGGVAAVSGAGSEGGGGVGSAVGGEVASSWGASGSPVVGGAGGSAASSEGVGVEVRSGLVVEIVVGSSGTADDEG